MESGVVHGVVSGSETKSKKPKKAPDLSGARELEPHIEPRVVPYLSACPARHGTVVCLICPGFYGVVPVVGRGRGGADRHDGGRAGEDGGTSSQKRVGQ